MKADYSEYRYLESIERIKEVLNSSDYNYEEHDSIPSRDRLTFTNGFYVKCSAMFVDMRDSKLLVEKYRRPTLARIYRSFISELIAVMKGHDRVCEVSIHGDCVWGVYDTQFKQNINQLISVSAQVSSMIDIFNWLLEKRDIDQIYVGIGIAYGRALMIKAGYRGSSVNEVVWMGDVINEASKLCSYGNRSYSDSETMISPVFYGNLNEHNKSLFTYNYNRDCYHGNIVCIGMNEWLNNQKSK